MVPIGGFQINRYKMEGASFKEVGEDDFNYEDLDLEAIGKDLGHDLIQAEEENVREANKNYDKEESDEEVYEVEDILDKKWSRSGQQLFLVKWVRIILYNFSSS